MNKYLRNVIFSLPLVHARLCHFLFLDASYLHYSLRMRTGNSYWARRVGQLPREHMARGCIDHTQKTPSNIKNNWVLSVCSTLLAAKEVREASAFACYSVRMYGPNVIKLSATR